MLELILETSTEKSLIVLCQGAKVIRYKRLSGGKNLSDHLATEVKKLLDGARPSRINVGRGPGSYTGLRVAAALAKGLALGWQIPLTSFCSLSAFGPEKPILFDARSAGFYALIDSEAEKIPPNDPRIPNLKRIFTPDREKIAGKIGSIVEVVEREIDPEYLCSLVFEGKEEPNPPLEMNYLS